jgi:hypothetical protein
VFTRRRQRDGEEAREVETAVKVAERGAREGLLATLLSAVAVAISCISFYMSALQAAELEIYLPSAFQYFMDGEGETFTVPVTLANSGALNTIVLSMELEVQDAKTNATRRFYSAYLGEHPRTQSAPQVRQFTPVVVLGRTVFSETVRFYPVGFTRQGEQKPPRIVSGEGEYTFRLKVNTAVPAEPSLLDRLQGRTQPAPVSVQMILPVVDYRGIMQLRTKDWVGAAGTSR